MFKDRVPLRFRSRNPLSRIRVRASGALIRALTALLWALAVTAVVLHLQGCSGSSGGDSGDDDDDAADDDDNDAGDGLPIDAADSNWTRADLVLAFGQEMRVRTEGTITVLEDGDDLGPHGTGVSCGLDCPGPSLPRGALIGRIVRGDGAGAPFLVGANYNQYVTRDGSLELIVNDDEYADNQGTFYADIATEDPLTGDDDDDGPTGLPSCHPANFAIQVLDVQYGALAGFGQKEFPDNVLGPPAGKGDYAPQSSETELLSLGEGGQITLKMGREILDGPGTDFLIFENVLYWSGNTANTYTEAAIVDVSQDGETWFTFPFDFNPDGPTGPQGLPDTVPENFVGFAGIEPTYGNCDPDRDGDISDAIDPLDPDIAGGDRFDLADVDMEWAAYVRIRDTGHIDRAPGTETYDDDGDLIQDGGNMLASFGGIQGFDLDAVGVVNGGEVLEPDDR
ncbi:MAG: hypothetical protein H6684_05085 [Deltaproteobacteria bacterium]|nr:hypothetical protein [Deltaproteobacteria bacterium]MCB9488083.1 hypothetical protein [Deltaproteobacteria bacterium]